MIYLVNAFSLNMLPADFDGHVAVKPITANLASVLARNVIPAIGHVDTAAVVAAELDMNVDEVIEAARKRPTVTLGEGAKALVAQYRGPRLPEGATSLPEGAKITYSLVIPI